MSKLCAIPTCKFKSSSVCYCCNQNLCVDHLKEHNESIKSKLHFLHNDITVLINQWTQIDRDKLMKNGFEKLDTWKNDCYKIINDYYEQKCQELEYFCNDKISQHKIKIDQLQTKIKDFIQKEKVTRQVLESLNASVSDIKQSINKMYEQGIRIDTQSLTLKNHLISIKDIRPKEFSIDKSTLLSSCHTIECMNDGGQSELISNEQFVLASLNNKMCLLDRDFLIAKHILWPFECVYGMCWSSSLSSFIAITNRKTIYRINETTLSIERIYGIEENNWLSCTCSNTYLYLTAGEVDSNIYQYRLLPLIRPVKQWQPPHSCKPGDAIHTIVYNNNNNTLALVIREAFGGVVNIELRSTTALNRIWLLPLTINTPGLWSRISCCSLNYNEWLVVDTTTSRFFHISEDGMLKTMETYDSKLNNAIIFGQDKLVIHTGTQIKFYQLS